jgi:hypothetical protein
MPEGIGRAFRGWPRIYFRQWKNLGLGPFLKETFWPSEWWLRLYYGIGPDDPFFMARWVKHPLFILKFILHRLRRRLPISKSTSLAS